uniref:RNA helicase n=1 Tax=Mucochytrium quahogii TaxID=96639 RepID=A0A7S2R7I9_9STRA
MDKEDTAEVGGDNMDDDNDDEEDPLDAFMSDVTKTHGSIKQEDLKNLSAKKTDVTKQKSSEQVKMITLDEIMNNTRNEEADEDELGEEEFHKRFMEELKKKREKEDARAELADKVRNEQANEDYNSLEVSAQQLGKGDSSEDGIGLMAQDDGGHDIVLSSLKEKGPSALELLKEKNKKKELREVDHSKIDYMPFRKDFYVESPVVKAQTTENVAEIRKNLEITIRGAKPLLNPISEWSQAGLSEKIMNVLAHRGWDAPFPIQRQAIPAIMAGRDIIGVAKTGSGKTLAFILPMFRHILDQPPLGADDGPIALLLAPARELAVQIHSEVRKFSKVLSIRSVCCYGGVGVKDQINAVKRGAEVLVATPGRLIDLLCTNSGRLLSLQRVSYIVLDEADRMFDMGFEPQVMRVIRNTRPDRQIVLFSATFPPLVERVATSVLKHKPLIIVVGGRTKPSNDIRQFIEVRQPHDKFARLLQLLGEWYERGNILVFVKSQDTCDKLFQQLLQNGYRCLSLHGGKDQIDRDYTILDFKQKKQTLMVATSVAGRGLDVDNLCLVINYDVPNHLEDYIHRIGRTGRAGKTGNAYTFIAPDEERYAPDLVKALKDSGQEVPKQLVELNNSFREKIAKGEAKFRNSGYRGSGYSFKEDEKSDLAKQQDLLRKQHEVSLGLRDSVEDEPAPTTATDSTEKKTSGKTKETTSKDSSTPTAASAQEQALQKVRQLVGQMVNEESHQSSSSTSIGGAGSGSGNYFSKELDINSYPQQARYKITHRETLAKVTEYTGCAIISRGVFVPPGRNPNHGERALYLLIEGESEYDVSRAVAEINRILDETTRSIGLGRGGKSSHKYKVL